MVYDTQPVSETIGTKLGSSSERSFLPSQIRDPMTCSFPLANITQAKGNLLHRGKEQDPDPERLLLSVCGLVKGKREDRSESPDGERPTERQGEGKNVGKIRSVSPR